MEKLGRLIEAARLRRGKSQEAIADEVGLTQSKYSRIERMGRGGVRELPAPDDLRRIGDALGLSMSEMLYAAGYLTGDEEEEVPRSSTVQSRLGSLLALLEKNEALLRYVEEGMKRDIRFYTSIQRGERELPPLDS